MDLIIMWGGYAATVIIAIIAVLTIQKKDVTNSRNVDELDKLREKFSLQKKELQKTVDSLTTKEQELETVQQDRDHNRSKLAALENDFEDKMDDVVQSSIQKISHAEEAKEEAVQAAHDNYEAAAEAFAKIKEQEQIIAELQQQLPG